jgi:hypothetical protein
MPERGIESSMSRRAERWIGALIECANTKVQSTSTERFRRGDGRRHLIRAMVARSREASRRKSAHWRNHELRANRIADAALQDAIDRQGGSVHGPAAHLIDRCEAARMAAPHSALVIP